MLRDFGLRAITASEIEFYLFGSHGQDLSFFWDGIRKICKDKNIDIFKIEKERGNEQYEISLSTCNDPEKTASDSNELKTIVTDLAGKYSMQANFTAKPVENDFGSGLHINIHLENEQGKNQFFKHDKIISDTLKYSLGGLLLWLPETMPVFAPNEESYSRFTEGGNAPLTVSWGANNRTVALRLPDSAHDNKRIEHRVAGADADVRQVILAILSAIYYGIKNQCEPNSQIYGDASLKIYNLERFPNDLEAAINVMKNSKLPLKEYDILT